MEMAGPKQSPMEGRPRVVEPQMSRQTRDHHVLRFVSSSPAGIWRVRSPRSSEGDLRCRPVSYTHLTLPTKRIV